MPAVDLSIPTILNQVSVTRPLVGARVAHHAPQASSFLSSQVQRDGVVLMAAFLLSFLFIRTSARLMRSPKVPWWPGSVTTQSGLHIHHLVWGNVLVLLSGLLIIALGPREPWSEILAAGFGIGAGLTLDEFALWVRLDDVYWSEEGRQSLDAVVVAALVTGLVVLGLTPFDTSDPSPSTPVIVIILLNALACIVLIFKGRSLLALIAVFIPVIGMMAALRLGSPSSPWARWRYTQGSRKHARCTSRFARARARHRRILDMVGGRPNVDAVGSADALATDPLGIASVQRSVDSELP
jgi:hypothetical protein